MVHFYRDNLCSTQANSTPDDPPTGGTPPPPPTK